MNSTRIIDFRKEMEKRRLLKEEEAFHVLEAGWVLYEEFAEVAPYIPPIILKKIKDLCEIILEGDRGDGS